MAQQQERALIGRMQVVEDDEHGPEAGETSQEVEDGLEEPVALHVRIGVSALGKVREDARQLWNEAAEFLSSSGGMQSEFRGCGRADVVRERLHERSVRHDQFVVTSTQEYESVLTLRLERELTSKASLPDPRLSGEQHHAAGLADLAFLPR